MAASQEINALRRLQREDRRLVSIEHRLEEIPRRVREMDADLQKLQQMLDGERAKLEESASFKAEQRHLLLEEEEHIKNAKVRMNSLKTPRELNAVTREIEGTRRMIQSRTQEIARISEAVSEAEARIESMTTSLGQFREEASKEQTRLESERAELTSKLEAAQSRRQEFKDKIETELLRTYERIRKRNGGLGFVAAHRRHCLACEMQVPHQLYVVLRRGDEIVYCDGCGRLLYWSGHFPKERDRLDAKDEQSEVKRRTAT